MGDRNRSPSRSARSASSRPERLPRRAMPKPRPHPPSLGRSRRPQLPRRHRRPSPRAAWARVAALAAAGKVAMPAEEEEEAASARPGRRVEAKRPAAPVRRANEQRRRTGKLTVTRALDDDAGERMRSLASVRRARERERQRMLLKEQPKIVREVVIPETITIQELANRMAERAADVIKSLMRIGVMATINQVLD